MIKINRGLAPSYLSSERVQLAKKRLEENFAQESRQERLKFDSSILFPIKGDLLKLCNGKCAYCESKLGVISDGDIENFRPKSGARGFSPSEYAPTHYWWLAFEWENLLIACQLCNQKYKRDYFPLENESFRSRIGATGDELLSEQALLIDPSLEDPAKHIEFDESGYARELSKKGKVTIEVLRLNRIELVERRLNSVRLLNDKLEIIRFTIDFKNKFTREFLAYINELYSDYPNQEYAAILRTVFDSWYERNTELWEQVKKAQRDSSETVRIQKNEGSEYITNEVEKNETESMLTSLKRFSIRKIEIKNFKSLENLELNVRAVDEKDSRESWLLMLGDN